jgi:C4-dicarboxylate-specific signal transduction histidine kinase
VALTAHELNNQLNGMSLQAAILERVLHEAPCTEVHAIKRLVENAAALVRRLQQVNAAGPPMIKLLDLNSLVASVVAEVGTQEAIPIEMHLEPQLPAVKAAAEILRRLIAYLLQRAQMVSSAETGPVQVRTERAGMSVAILIEDHGPVIDEDKLERAFEPGIIENDREPQLVLSACQMLVRRLGGELVAQNRNREGLRLTVRLDAGAE